MSDTHLLDSSYSGLLRLGSRNQLAIENWDVLTAFIRSELGEKFANLLAEPEHIEQDSYAWFSQYVGTSKRVDTLEPEQQKKLCAEAQSALTKIRGLGSAAKASNNIDRQRIGEMLLHATTLPYSDADLSKNLFAIDGKLVLINWGARNPDISTESRHLDHEYTEKIPPAKSQSIDLSRFAVIFLWLVFTLLITASFVRLILGCALLSSLGLGPNYCYVTEAPINEELNQLQKQTASLLSELNFTQKQIVEAPICGTSSPAYVGHKQVTSPESEEPIKKKGGGPSIFDSEVEDHLFFNSIVRSSGVSKCEGPEVFAVWDDGMSYTSTGVDLSIDVDIRLYCLDLLDKEDKPVIVDAYNPQACGATWDIGNEGRDDILDYMMKSMPDSNLDTFVDHMYAERICLSKEAPEGAFYATAYINENPHLKNETPSVFMFVRIGDDIDIAYAEGKPGEEIGDGIRFIIDE